MNIRHQSDYWASIDKANRYYHHEIATKRSKWFVEKLDDLEFSSVLEIGSCSGRNIAHILDRFPDVDAYGVDINQKAVNFANKSVPKAKFGAIDIYDLKTDKTWDLIFTMAVLVHINPNGIRSIIEKCTKVANKYIIHIERNGDNSFLEGSIVSRKLHWQPDIVGMYEDLGLNPIVTEVPDGINGSGASHFIFIEL
jgi:SAM-dependent methyltransferase